MHEQNVRELSRYLLTDAISELYGVRQMKTGEKVNLEVAS